MIPLLATGVAVLIVFAGALGRVGQDLVVVAPGVADTPRSATDGSLDSGLDADCLVVKIRGNAKVVISGCVIGEDLGKLTQRPEQQR